MARRDAALRAMRDHDISQRRACNLVGVDPKTVRRERPPDNPETRKEMGEIAEKRRRFGYRRIGILLERKGITMNHKKLYRLYREEGLSVRRRRGRKRARGSRSPMPQALRPNQRWSMDFVSDTFGASRRFARHCSRTNGAQWLALAVSDDCCRENLGLIADTSISGDRVTRELDALVRLYGKPESIVSDNVLCREILLLRSAGHGASGVPDALIRLPRRALPSRNDLFHSKHRVRALAALTVLNTRSQIPSRRPEHYLRGQQAASTARQREVLPPGLTPSKKGR
jgi:transposase InsO family protein